VPSKFAAKRKKYVEKRLAPTVKIRSDFPLPTAAQKLLMGDGQFLATDYSVELVGRFLLGSSSPRAVKRASFMFGLIIYSFEKGCNEHYHRRHFLNFVQSISEFCAAQYC